MAFSPYTPATNMLQGLRVALDLLAAEGMEAVFARHKQASAATRAAAAHGGLETQCAVAAEHASALTALRLPEGHSADALRAEILQRSDMSLGNGLGPLADRVFRIGHLGDFNDIAVTAVIAGVEAGLTARGVPHQPGGVEAALRSLAGNG